MHSWQWLIVVIVLAISFSTMFYLIYRFAEHKNFRLSLWITSPIIAIINSAITVGLIYLLNYGFWFMFIISIIWGVGLGYISGHANYKFKSRFEKGKWGGNDF